MSEEHHPYHNIPIESWEMDLLRKVARRFRTFERDELEAELARKLLVLKSGRLPVIRDWRAYLAKFFFNKASNWIRQERARNYREVDLANESEDDDVAATSRGIDKSITPESASAFSTVCNQLDPALLTLWKVLIEENGNQIRVARRLGKHRNTIRAWVSKIRQVLIVHELQPSFRTDCERVTRGSRTSAKSASDSLHKEMLHVVLSTRFLEGLLRGHLSGTQWRLLLWVIRHAARRKQKTILCQWSDMARALSLHRSSVLRAGRTLARTRLLYVKGSRIGVPQEFGSSSDGRETTADDSTR